MIRKVLCALLCHDWGPWLPRIVVGARWRSCYRCHKQQVGWYGNRVAGTAEEEQ